jgi:hypothetical protein
MDAEALVAALRDALPGGDVVDVNRAGIDAADRAVGRDDLPRVARVLRDGAGLEFACLSS